MTPIHYLVWKKNGGRKPRFKHPNAEAAMAEATRLANLTGAKFHVLAMLAEVTPQEGAQDQSQKEPSHAE